MVYAPYALVQIGSQANPQVRNNISKIYAPHLCEVMLGHQHPEAGIKYRSSQSVLVFPSGIDTPSNPCLL